MKAPKTIPILVLSFIFCIVFLSSIIIFTNSINKQIVIDNESHVQMLKEEISLNYLAIKKISNDKHELGELLHEQSTEKPSFKFPEQCVDEDEITEITIPIWNLITQKEDTMNIKIHKKYAQHIKIVFEKIRYSGFDINPYTTIGYSCRKTFDGGGISQHGIGAAIDINANINPMLDEEGNIISGRSYTIGNLGTITPDSVVVKAFEAIGWKWMGSDNYERKDYMHFSANGM